MTEPTQPDVPVGVTVAERPERMRYEVYSNGALAGYAEYRRRQDHVVFTHTQIDDAFEGHGLGGKLAKGALDDVRSRGLRVIAKCPFIAEWIRRHPDYTDLVDPEP